MLTTGIILGISEEHDAGVCIVQDGRILFAANEERFTRKKRQGGFPRQALWHAVRYLQDHQLLEQISAVAVANLIHNAYVRPHSDRQPTVIQHLLGIFSLLRLGPFFLGTEFGVRVMSWMMRRSQYRDRRRRLRQGLHEVDLGHLPLHFYDHHLCHGASAYYTSGFDRCLVVSIDAAGDGYCSRVYEGNTGRLRLLHSIPFFHSIGYYYSAVMILLGFKDGQEGKVTGMAARGDPSKTINIFRQRIGYDSARKIFRNRGKYFLYEIPSLQKALRGYTTEDIAAGMQQHLEESVTMYIQDLIKTFHMEHLPLALAGGIFANVLLNERVSRIPGVPAIFIHPHMGDGGLATGAALLLDREISPSSSVHALTHVYLGTDIDEHAVWSACPSGFSCFHADNSEEEIAEFLDAGNIVARVEGRMEYGPRALGHRSILCSASDAGINDRLNALLHRSEFMPFAPAVLEEDAAEFFELNGQTRNAAFMTITCRVTDRCRRECPAIVHIDGTARPQIVSKAQSPSFHRILEEYKKRTGIPVLINTSFNMHEEPIVSSVEEAIDTFVRSHIDVLAIGSSLISRVMPKEQVPELVHA